MKAIIQRKGSSETGSVRQLLQSWKEESDSVLWIDALKPSRQEVINLMQKLDLPEDVITLFTKPKQPSRAEFYNDYLFVSFKASLDVDNHVFFKSTELKLLSGPGFFLSVHNDPIPVIENEMNRESFFDTEDPREMSLHLINRCTTKYLDHLLEFDDRLSELEDQLNEQGDDQILGEITAYKGQLLKLNRTFTYHRHLSESILEWDALHQLDPENNLVREAQYLNGKFERLRSMSRMYYEICGDLVDGYLSITTHQLNNTMKVLTVITAIFIPLSFLAGVYGMNFKNIPELEYEYGYFILLAVMFSIAAGLMVLFKKKRWL